MIVIFKDTKTKYQWLAKQESPGLLSGRRNYHITEARNREIIKLLYEFEDIYAKKNAIDVGCGDGSLAMKIKEVVNCTYLTVFTEAERELLKNLGTADVILVCNSYQIPVPDNYFELLICNSVLHSYGSSPDHVTDSIREFSRIVKNDGVAYIGEIPFENSIKISNISSSSDFFIKYFKIYGLLPTSKLFSKLLSDIVMGRDFIINDIPEFWIDELSFKELANKYGFIVLTVETDFNTKRNNYVLKKIR